MEGVKMSMTIKKGDYIDISYSPSETVAVQRAISNLRRDLMCVLDAKVNVTVNACKQNIYVCSLNADVENCAENMLDEARQKLSDESGGLLKEAYMIKESQGNLFILGTDRRGTIYGIYDFCQNVLGVSPWHFFADVPMREKQDVHVETGYESVDHPAIEYRGIFINDEEELEHWVQRYMGEDTLGIKTYEKIFELLLRLKMNYIWPAMHVNSFNIKKENGALANEMGIVVGTSHCDMLMRSNNREWKPWIDKKKYEGVEYDYSVPGKNREVLQEYWRESVEQNKDFEVSYTLGMRGIHDSGFEVRGLQGKTGEELLKGKIQLLTDVMSYQDQMLGEVLEGNTQKNFVPYKEVLELYDNGLEVPEDMTLIWVNDNYGYVRRYPGAKEKERKGGNGIYYHNSYWAPPGNSYLFICSIPLAHTRNELQKAYEEGIQKLWVTNFGAIKPLEQQLTYYAAFAWNAGKNVEYVENEQLFLEKWIDMTFSGNLGKELAPILTRFDQLTNVRKVEHMVSGVFTQDGLGDEGADRLHEYEELFTKVNQMHRDLPEQEQDAFFQMFVMKIHAAYYTNAMYYYGDRSILCNSQKKYSAADKYVKLSKQYDHARRSMLYYYNHVMSNGKWNGILTPEDFPPPRTNMHPLMMPALHKTDKGLVVTIWGNQSMLEFINGKKKWIELSNAGEGSINCEINAPEWINIDQPLGIVDICEEKRILISVDWDQITQDSQGEIVITSETQESVVIPVKAITGYLNTKHVDEDGYLVVEAEHSLGQNLQGWKKIDNLGRGKGALLEGRSEGAKLSYEFTLRNSCSPTLELHRFPTLNSVGRLRVGVSIDDGGIQILESMTNDEHMGNWKYNVQNNIDRIYMDLPLLESGKHIITFHVVDKYVAFSRFVIYTQNVEQYRQNLAYEAQNQNLPKEWDLEGFVRGFYGKESGELSPRPVIYHPVHFIGDTLSLEDTSIYPETYGGTVTSDYYLKQGEKCFEESNGCISIELASALANTSYAKMTDDGCWSYCQSPSHGESGLALYIPERTWLNDGATHYSLDEAPKLSYKIRTNDGEYYLWLRSFSWGNDELDLAIYIDDVLYAKKDMCGGKSIWCYSSENIWKWVPLLKTDLTQGEHTIEICALSSKLRLEQIYLTSGEELPPVTA